MTDINYIINHDTKIAKVFTSALTFDDTNGLKFAECQFWLARFASDGVQRMVFKISGTMGDDLIACEIKKASE